MKCTIDNCTYGRSEGDQLFCLIHRKLWRYGWKDNLEYDEKDVFDILRLFQVSV